jgi:hypothetical protein
VTRFGPSAERTTGGAEARQRTKITVLVPGAIDLVLSGSMGSFCERVNATALRWCGGSEVT